MAPTRYINVSRDVIVRAAKGAIANVRAEGHEVTTATARTVLKSARSHDKYLLHEWHIGSCGCLIGNLIGESIDIESVPAELIAIGIDFDVLVCEDVGVNPFGTCGPAPIILRVLED